VGRQGGFDGTGRGCGRTDGICAALLAPAGHRQDQSNRRLAGCAVGLCQECRGPLPLAISGARGKCWTLTTGMAGNHPRAGTASKRGTSGLSSPRLQCDSHASEEESRVDGGWQGLGAAPWSGPRSTPAVADAIVASVHAGWLAKTSCVHSSATIASSERRVDQRSRRSLFILGDTLPPFCGRPARTAQRRPSALRPQRPVMAGPPAGHGPRRRSRRPGPGPDAARPQLWREQTRSSTVYRSSSTVSFTRGDPLAIFAEA
jgi:hypothetical protein